MSRRHSQMRLTDDIKAHLVYIYVTGLCGYRICGETLLDGTIVLGFNKITPGAVLFMEQKKLVRRVTFFRQRRAFRRKMDKVEFYMVLTDFGMRKLRQFADIEMLKASCVADSL